MACVRFRRGRWCVDWREEGARHWRKCETKEEAERFLQEVKNDYIAYGRQWKIKGILEIPKVGSAVYILTDGKGFVIYIGQSRSSVYRRLGQHHIKNFERIFVIPCDPGITNDLEAFLIKLLRLAFNGGTNSTKTAPKPLYSDDFIRNKLMEVLGAAA